MGDQITIGVPPEHVETFRESCYSLLSGCGESLEQKATPLALPDGESGHRANISDPEQKERYM